VLISTASEPPQPALGQDFGKHHVVRLVGHALHLLAVEGDADEVRPAAPLVQPRDRSLA
jgi:hypothetical protein